MNSIAKTLVFWIVIVVSAFLLWQTVKSGNSPRAVAEISYSDFLTRVAGGQVGSVTIAGSVVNGVDAKGGSFRVIAPANQTAMLETLQQHGVSIWFKETPGQNWPNWLLNLAPLVLLAALWFFMVRQMQKRRSGGDGPSAYPPPPDAKIRFGA
ncbi:MAG: ATP-dependent metallopeptidase FtsH/Yme1/Tma family protein [Terriglobales bacterium]